MKIEINNSNTEVTTLLISKFLELNANSDYNYFDKDSIYVGYNENSKFSYVYLENNPSICLVSDSKDKLCLVYSSGLDGIEFIRYDLDNIKSLLNLEDLMHIAYTMEDNIREDNYEDENKKEEFINAMLQNGWEELCL